MVSRFHVDLAQIAINREIVSMPDDNGMIISRNSKNTGDFTFEYGNRFRTGGCLYINAIVICTDIFQVLMLLFSEWRNDEM